MNLPWYRKYSSGKTLTENQEKLVSKFDSQKDLENEIPLELLYGPSAVNVKQVASWLEFKEKYDRWPTYEEAFMSKPMPPDKDSNFPDYQHKQGWEMPEIPPLNKPSPPEPPKPHCLADDPEHKKQQEKTIIWSAKLWTLVAALSMLVNSGSLILLPDPRIDPKRTDHAVQAGIRECERTLPRTQTCELSELSFKVVEKKQW